MQTKTNHCFHFVSIINFSNQAIYKVSIVHLKSVLNVISLHLVLLVSERIVRLLSCFGMMLVVNLIVFTFHVHIVVMLLLLVTSSKSLLLVHFLLSQLASHQVFSGLLLALVVLASLLLFESL